MRKYTTFFLRPFANFVPLKPYFVKNRWPLVIGLVSLLAVDFLQLVIPLIIKRVVNLLTTQTVTTRILLQQSVFILGIAVAIVVLRYIWRMLIFGHARWVEESLRNRLYQHLQTLSLSFYQKMKTGDIMARSINDINAVRMATGMGLVALVDGIVLGTAAIGFMLFISAKLTLLSLIPAPLIVIFSRILTRKMSLGFDKVQATFSDLTERVRESFAGIRVIKAYGREGWEHKRVIAQGEQYISVNMSLTKTLALFFPLMAIFTNLGLAVVIWVGGRLTIIGQITIGDFVAFTAYLNLLAWPMMAMGWVANQLQRGSASMGRINRILEEKPEIEDQPDSTAPDEIKGRISFRGLRVRYPSQRADTLKDIQFEVAQGQTVAVVGGVGSGKTTLLQTIPRILDMPPGVLFVDGHDVRGIRLSKLRKNIGFVTQEPFIFSDTIRNNVLFGREDISPDTLEKVLRAVGIYHEIQELEKGLDTLLGERGVTLSGGQRQRLTIARALVINPPILILDDALSMVDTRTEEHILNQIMQTRRSMTNLLVSHRVSTIARAENIVVLEEGKVVELGGHDSLMALKGTYARLYRRQLLAQELEAGDA